MNNDSLSSLLHKKSLYVVSTYYHALIACVKQLNNGCNASILCTDYIPEGEILSKRIIKSGLFNQVFYIQNIQEYIPQNKLDYLLNFHRKNAAQIELGFPTGFKFENYEEINIFHEDTWMAHYLKSKRIRYRLIEDALNNYHYLSQSAFYYLFPPKGIKLLLKRLLKIGYLFLGADGLAYEIEVNKIDGVEFNSDRLIEVPRAPLFNALSASDKDILLGMFGKGIPDIPNDSVLLFTQPLYTDGFVKTEEEQITLYQRLVNTYCSDKKLVIKPHPRDGVDYSLAFPDSIILDKNMPSELLGYMFPWSLENRVSFPNKPLTINGMERYIKLGEYIYLN